MKNVKSITIENHLKVLEGLKYGINMVTYQDEKAYKCTHAKIKVLNAYFDSSAIEEFEALNIEKEDGTFIEKIPGVMSIFFRKHNTEIPLLHPDNYKGETILKEVCDNCSISDHLNIDVRLIKYYRNLGLVANVKFKDNRFDASQRKIGPKNKVGGGILYQIRESYLKGEKNVSFSSYRSSIQGVRNATSSFGKMVNRKFKVEIHGYEIFVVFKEFSGSEKNELALKNLILLMKKYDTKEKITALFHEFLELEVEEKNNSIQHDKNIFEFQNEIEKEYEEIEETDKVIQFQNIIQDDLELDTRLDYDDDDEQEPNKFDWGSLQNEDDDF